MKLEEKGRKALGIVAGQSDRHGGSEHRYWASRLAESLRGRGYEVIEEAPLGGGKTIDLLARKDGRRIAFEIETGRSDPAANVRKCLAAGVDQIVVVATSQAARESLSKTLSGDPRVRVVGAAEATVRRWGR